MVTFVETRLFSRLVGRYLDEDEYSLVRLWLLARPRSGVVVPGTGGLRKLRWGRDGRGKRGGVRIVYLLRDTEREIWFVTIYSKNEDQDLPLHVLRRIREEIDG